MKTAFEEEKKSRFAVEKGKENAGNVFTQESSEEQSTLLQKRWEQVKLVKLRKKMQQDLAVWEKDVLKGYKINHKIVFFYFSVILTAWVG